MPVPNTFANATTSIPLSQLDANFATAITLGNTAIQLGNTVTTLNNMSLANVTVSTGNVSFTQGTIGGNVVINTTGTANTGNLAVTGTLTTTDNITVNKTSASGVIRTQYNSTVLGSFAASSANYVGIGSESAHDVLLLRNSAEIARVSSTGLAVTGTLSSTGTASINGATNNYALNVKGSGTVGDSSVYIQLTTLDTGTTNADGGAIGMGVGTSPIMYLTNYENAAMAFSTNASEKMRLDSSGNLLVGATSAAANEQGLVVRSADAAGKLTGNFICTSSATSAYGIATTYSALTPNNTGSEFYGAADPTATRFQVRSNGGIANYSANNVNLSDLSVKEEFAVFSQDAALTESIWQFGKRMKNAWGRFKYADQTHADWNNGYGAQLVRDAAGADFPELVEQTDWKNDGEEKSLLMVYDSDLMHLVGYIVTVSQERIEALEAKVAALEAA